MQCTYCFKNISEKKHMPRHMKVCKLKNDELTLLKNEVSTLKDEKHELEKKLFDMENGIEVQRLKDEKRRLVDEMIELQKKLLEKQTNVKNVNVTNNVENQNNYVLNLNIITTESELNEKNVRQMIRNSMSQVPESLRRKFCSQDSTKNIRFFVTDESDGKLRCEKIFDSENVDDEQE